MSIFSVYSIFGVIFCLQNGDFIPKVKGSHTSLFKFEVEPTDTVYNEEKQDKIFLFCKASCLKGCSEPVQYEWTRDGMFLRNGSIYNMPNRDGTLSITTGSLEVDITGQYNCFASNSIGTIKSRSALLSKADLYWSESPNDMNITRIFEVKNDGYLHIPLPKYTIHPAHAQVTWRIDHPLVAMLPKSVTTVSGGLFLHIATKMTTNGDILLRAIVTNEEARRSIQLVVLVNNYITSADNCTERKVVEVHFPDNLVAFEGENITAEALVYIAQCRIPLKIHWEVRKKIVSFNRKLIIKKASMLDSGVYSCYIGINSLTFYKNISITILRHPQIKTSSPIRYLLPKTLKTFRLMGNILSRVVNTSILHMKCQWFQDGRLIKTPYDSSRYTVDKDCNLQLNSLSAADSGIYTIVFSYASHFISHHVQVGVEPKFAGCGGKVMGNKGVISFHKNAAMRVQTGTVECVWRIHFFTSAKWLNSSLKLVNVKFNETYVTLEYFEKNGRIVKNTTYSNMKKSDSKRLEINIKEIRIKAFVEKPALNKDFGFDFYFNGRTNDKSSSLTSIPVLPSTNMISTSKHVKATTKSPSATATTPTTSALVTSIPTTLTMVTTTTTSPLLTTKTHTASLETTGTQTLNSRWSRTSTLIETPALKMTSAATISTQTISTTSTTVAKPSQRIKPAYSITTTTVSTATPQTTKSTKITRPSDTDNEDVNAVIIGGLLGGVILLIINILVLLYIRKMIKKGQAHKTSSTKQSSSKDNSPHSAHEMHEMNETGLANDGYDSVDYEEHVYKTIKRNDSVKSCYQEPIDAITHNGKRKTDSGEMYDDEDEEMYKTINRNYSMKSCYQEPVDTKVRRSKKTTPGKPSLKKKISSRRLVQRNDSNRSNLYHVLETEYEVVENVAKGSETTDNNENVYQTLGFTDQGQYEALNKLNKSPSPFDGLSTKDDDCYAALSTSKQEQTSSLYQSLKKQSKNNNTNIMSPKTTIPVINKQIPCGGTPGGKYNTEDYVYM